MAVVLWLALSSPLGVAIVGKASSALQVEYGYEAEPECLLDEVIERTPMVERFIDIEHEEGAR